MGKPDCGFKMEKFNLPIKSLEKSLHIHKKTYEFDQDVIFFFRENKNEDFYSKTVIHGILGFLQGRC